MGPADPHLGTVESFDGDVGIGWVRSGRVRWMFHCTTIADGTRQVDVGAEVEFVVVAGGPGQWEATDLRPITQSPPGPWLSS